VATQNPSEVDLWKDLFIPGFCVFVLHPDHGRRVQG